ncbi:MAG: PTS mannose/fructose/sorbose transporter subunit IIB [Myxococcales bacterium]|nr:PTS mannose/fructose/sorbose transporter subunit IIB [Myxococcales bacterium]
MNPFYRIDNRLVHGQIIATWMPHLRYQRILIASDDVPENALQMTMFRMAIPQAVAFDAQPIKAAARTLSTRVFGNERVLVLLQNVEDAVRLFNAGNPFANLNIGNVHHSPERRRFTNAVYLGEGELEQLRVLIERGVRVEIQSLPTETPIDLKQTLASEPR